MRSFMHFRMHRSGRSTRSERGLSERQHPYITWVPDEMQAGTCCQAFVGGRASSLLHVVGDVQSRVARGHKRDNDSGRLMTLL